MSKEGLITSHQTFPSLMIENVYTYLYDFSPLYVQRLLELAEAFESEMGDEYGPLGWGVFSAGWSFSHDSELTGRGYCAAVTELFARALTNRFPLLNVVHQKGRVKKYNPHNLAANETIRHQRLEISDSLTPGPSFRVDGTIRQVAPHGPFILFSENETTIMEVRDSKLRTIDQHNDFENWFCFTNLTDHYTRQKEAYERFFSLADL